MSLLLGPLQMFFAACLVASMIGMYRLGPRRPGRSGALRIAGEALWFAAALAGVAGLVVLFVVGHHREEPSLASPVFVERDGDGGANCPPVEPGRPPRVVDVVHGEGPRAWLAEAAEQFMRRCPHVEIRLTASEDLDAARAILRDELRPTVWVPEDDLALEYLAERWRARSDEPLFRPDERRSLARSPLVVLAWDERLRALETLRAAGDGAEPWPAVLCPPVPRAATGAGERRDPARWLDWYRSLVPAGPRPGAVPPALAGLDPARLQEWGDIRFLFPSPSRSTAGAATLALLVGRQPGGDAGPDGALGDFLRRCRGGLAAPSTADGLVEALRTDGPARTDGVVTHEHRAFPALARAAALGPSTLRVAYLQPTLVARHPAVPLWPDDASRAEELAAARSWLDFVTSAEVQRSAVSFGLRPADPTAALGELDLIDNPFRALRRFGVQLDPPLAEAARPDGAALRALLETWDEAFGPG